MQQLAQRLGALDQRRTAAVLFASVAAIGVMGVLAIWLDTWSYWFSLDAEVGFAWPPTEMTLALPAIWSSVLFACAGICWIAAAYLQQRGWSRNLGLLLGVILLFFALDELFLVHERLNWYSGIDDWQLLYTPLILVTGSTIVILAARFANLDWLISLLLLAAAACWVASAVLERLQWNEQERVELYNVLMVPEELLELCGSVLLALGALRLIRRSLERNGGDEPIA